MMNVRFESSYQKTVDLSYIDRGIRGRIEAGFAHETGTFYVRDDLGKSVVEQYLADQIIEWERWLRGKSTTDRESFGPYPTRAVVIDACEWERRVYPNCT